MAKDAQNTEMIEWIKKQIKYVFSEELGENGEKILSVLERGEVSGMEDLFERINANEKAREEKLRNEGLAKGIKRGITKMIRNMLKYNEDDETIMKYTNAKKEDIDKVRKELGMLAN